MGLELPDERPPLPPLELIDRVTRPFAAADADYVREGFDTYPRLQLEALERALQLVERTFDDFDRVLDFGCGPGRLLRHLGPLAATTELHGADVDADAIQWLQANLRFGQYRVIPAVPPTDYPAGWFDLVVAHSVFTHLDATQQDRWLEELQRISSPGAILLVTVHGGDEWRGALRDLRNGGEDDTAWRRAYAQDGVVHVRDDHFIGSAHGDAYHTIFHAPWYVIDHWARWFDIVAYIPRGVDVQDLVVLRRRDEPTAADGSSPAALEDVTSAGDEPVAETPLVARATALARRLAARADRPWTERVTAAARGDRGDVDAEIAAVLGDVVAALTARDREIAMLRVGVYEQGRRISLVARQLREDLDAAELRRGEHAD